MYLFTTSLLKILQRIWFVLGIKAKLHPSLQNSRYPAPGYLGFGDSSLISSLKTCQVCTSLMLFALLLAGENALPPDPQIVIFSHSDSSQNAPYSDATLYPLKRHSRYSPTYNLVLFSWIAFITLSFYLLHTFIVIPPPSLELKSHECMDPVCLVGLCVPHIHQDRRG